MRRSCVAKRSQRRRADGLGYLIALALACLAAASPVELSAAEPAGLGQSGLPLPRFVSLRADEANLRTGPGRTYPIDWIYTRSGLPLEVIDEFDTWRRVRDHDGTSGWMHRSVLDSRRRVIVTAERSLLRREPNVAGAGLAYLEAGVTCDLTDCDGSWCLVEVMGLEGWLARTEIWGANQSE